MRVQEAKIDNEVIIQIFLTKQEAEENIQEIEDIKKKNKKVVMFLAGDKDIKKTLLDMVQSIKENQT